MTLVEFIEKYKRAGESVVSIAELALKHVNDDAEFVLAANRLVEAEDKFYRMMLERGLEQ